MVPIKVVKTKKVFNKIDYRQVNSKLLSNFLATLLINNSKYYYYNNQHYYYTVAIGQMSTSHGKSIFPNVENVKIDRFYSTIVPEIYQINQQQAPLRSDPVAFKLLKRF